MNIIEAAKVIEGGRQVYSRIRQRKLARLFKNDRVLSIEKSDLAHGLTIQDLLADDYEVVE